MSDPSGFLTPIGHVWVVCSCLAAGCTSLGFIFPYWIVGTITLNDRPHSAFFGVYRRCNYPVFNEALQQFQMHTGCGIYVSFTDIPSVFWQVAALFVGFSSFISIVLVMIVVPSACLGLFRREMITWIRLLQLVAAVGVAVGCALYPIGWTNPEVRDACGLAVDVYALGECRLGWAFFSLLAGSGLLLFSALLSTCSLRPSSVANRRPSASSVRRRSSGRLARDEQSFDAEALINKNLRLPAAQPRWEHYAGDQSPFVPRHSELV